MSLAALYALVDPDEDWVDIFCLVAIILGLIAAYLFNRAALASALLAGAVAAIAAALLFVS
jgi:hypothetical protein